MFSKIWYLQGMEKVDLELEGSGGSLMLGGYMSQ